MPNWWTDQGLPLPLHLGYFLVNTPLRQYDTLCGKAYKGINRLLYLPFDYEDANNIVLGKTNKYLNAVDRFTNEDRIHVRTQLARAIEFSRLFAGLGFPNEVVFTSVISVPSDPHAFPGGSKWAKSIGETAETHLGNHYALRDRSDLTEFKLLGFDVSLPTPSFHSSLVNPGLADLKELHVPRLNESGLFNEIADAVECMDSSNRLGYSDLPFCILAVHEWTD
jgi:hypothetical protein